MTMRGRAFAAGVVAALALLGAAAVLAAKYDSAGREVVALGTALACERNTESGNNGYCIVFEDWNSTAIDVSVDSTTVSPLPTRLGCVTINTALSAHDLLIKDGTATICTVPASAAVGSSFCGCKGTRADLSLVADPNDAATGNVNVQWRPQ